LSVSHVTVTVNAVDPVIGGRIYAWVRRSAEPLRGSEAGAHLWESQRRGIAALVRLGVLVKVNTVLIPAVNESHVVEVAHAALRLGAARINCLPLHPIAGTPFGDRAAPSSCLLRRVQSECARYLPLMGHCARCRADAVGRVGQHRPEDYAPALQQRAARKDRPYIAVLSRERLLVNLRLGEAERVFVFGRSDDGYRLVDTRRARPTAAGVGRWLEIANLLSDCRALLVRGAGASAKAALSTSGVEVIETEGLIEDALDAVYQGRPVPRPRETSFRCAKNAGCAGSGTLCG
jgi:nitrogen fixation protein NifB